jgi:hypothetical protein
MLPFTLREGHKFVVSENKKLRTAFGPNTCRSKELIIIIIIIIIIIMGATTQGGSWPAQDNASIGNGQGR